MLQFPDELQKHRQVCNDESYEMVGTNLMNAILGLTKC